MLQVYWENPDYAFVPDKKGDAKAIVDHPNLGRFL